MIDDGELILDKALCNYICKDLSNQYIIFSHSFNGFRLWSKYNVAELVINGNKGYFEFPLAK